MTMHNTLRFQCASNTFKEIILHNRLLFTGGIYFKSIQRFFSTEQMETSRTNKKRFSCPIVFPEASNLRKYGKPAVLPGELHHLFVSPEQEFSWPASRKDRELCERAFGNEKTQNVLLLKSCWGKRKHRLSRVLYPNVVLESLRRQDVITKRPATESQTFSNVEIDSQKQKKARENMERLDSLWTLTTSQGVDWNYIDQIYTTFLNTHNNCLNEFSAKEQELRTEAGRLAKEITVDERKAYFKNKQISLEEIPVSSSLRCPRSHVYNIARFLFYCWKRAYFEPFQPGALTKILKFNVTTRILARELNERYLGILDKK